MGTRYSVSQLNRMLRGELAAVETYRMLLESLCATSDACDELEDCLSSHEERVVVLHEAILILSGDPSPSSGLWGVFARVVARAAQAFGGTSAIAALKQGEVHGLCDYSDDLTDPELDMQIKLVVSKRLLPAQRATYERISALVHRMRWSTARSSAAPWISAQAHPRAAGSPPRTPPGSSAPWRVAAARPGVWESGRARPLHGVVADRAMTRAGLPSPRVPTAASRQDRSAK